MEIFTGEVDKLDIVAENPVELRGGLNCGGDDAAMVLVGFTLPACV